jgi:hypothetical protein
MRIPIFEYYGVLVCERAEMAHKVNDGVEALYQVGSLAAQHICICEYVLRSSKCRRLDANVV